MDPCGSSVFLPPGSPVWLDICKPASPAAAFKEYQFVGECGQAGGERGRWGAGPAEGTVVWEGEEGEEGVDRVLRPLD